MPETEKKRNHSLYNSSEKPRSTSSSSIDSRRGRKLQKRHRRRSHFSRSTSRSSVSRDRSSESCKAYKRKRYYGTREHPYKSSILGVFGLSNYVNHRDLYELFSDYGHVDEVRIIYDKKTHNSRGFGFVYFRHIDDASRARRKCNGLRLLGRRIRVDYSITKRAHTPTPGFYMGHFSKSETSHRP